MDVSESSKDLFACGYVDAVVSCWVEGYIDSNQGQAVLDMLVNGDTLHDFSQLREFGCDDYDIDVVSEMLGW